MSRGFTLSHPAKIRFNPEKDRVLREDGKIVPKKSDFGMERVWIFAKIEFKDGKKQRKQRG